MMGIVVGIGGTLLRGLGTRSRSGVSPTGGRLRLSSCVHQPRGGEGSRDIALLSCERISCDPHIVVPVCLDHGKADAATQLFIWAGK